MVLSKENLLLKMILEALLIMILREKIIIMNINDAKTPSNSHYAELST